MSRRVTALLAAELVISFLERESKRPEEPRAKSRTLPSHLLEVEEGFPRMAVVMAYYLHIRFNKTEEDSKKMARTMVETWITCGLEYSRLHQICLSDQRTAHKQVALHELLVQKSSTELTMNMFQVSSMIDLTIRYFYRAVKANDA